MIANCLVQVFIFTLSGVGFWSQPLGIGREVVDVKAPHLEAVSTLALEEIPKIRYFILTNINRVTALVEAFRPRPSLRRALVITRPVRRRGVQQRLRPQQGWPGPSAGGGVEGVQ